MFKNLLLALALLLTTVSCNSRLIGQFTKSRQSSNTPTQGALSSSEQKKYTIVILSKYGTIKQAAGGQYQLVVDYTNIDKVIAFGANPYRIVKTSTGKSLANSWNEGVNSFAEDPPNAAVVINQQLQMVTLLSIEIVGNQMVFSIKADGPQSLTVASGRTTVFIDSGWCVGGFCLPCGCSDPGCNSPNSCD